MEHCNILQHILFSTFQVPRHWKYRYHQIVTLSRILNSEWLNTQHRDSLASFVSHQNLLRYFSIAENESIERTRLNLLDKMIQPCGPPPKKTLAQELLNSGIKNESADY
ncbi:Splicing factor 3B subunit 5/RDS3 complex subunit 10 domain-containing protein [Rozella allomycis CSF55]|uniref:Splicing factor 3B subunit 5/RDS3 complex subunit 10 domain-containing protein n=1 Tax=Rozella allomycis (strain CSF55) TaxID=988480 RepID=A0A075B4I8_ROZAC|nr:Splicing factor 3B subunit 5/RDS3 complex subunit 10 domain-containing protein [Rozella allomycis CSF55]|eukprot:EPZ36197.1 Splicing factor 3B subunit 5/RDS3 complex subunit 10 domain-containing protein [Rozella allomycis CSF55]